MALNRHAALAVSIAVAAAGAGIAVAADDWGSTVRPTAAERGAGGDRGKRLKLRSSEFGRVLFDGRNRALYLFTRDGRKSDCYGRCAKVWPPFRARHGVEAGAGLKQRWVDTVRRRGGAKQITFRGHPLYFYAHDPRGEILCHDVFEFGGEWFVVRKSGDPAP